MRNLRSYGAGAFAVASALLVFGTPFAFILLMAGKTQLESADLSFSLPEQWQLVENVKTVIQNNDYEILRAFWNSALLTFFSVTIGVTVSAMAAWVLARRRTRVTKAASAILALGLMIPPAVVPTILLLQKLNLFATFPSMVAIEVAFMISFTTLLFRGFIATIPEELDEAAMIDGVGPIRLFFSVIFPILRSVIITGVILNSVFVFNDFVNPLYFLPGSDHATIQTTLFSYQDQFLNRYHLLFTDILLITVPMVILFAFFNKRIVAGMTAGAVKG